MTRHPIIQTNMVLLIEKLGMDKMFFMQLWSLILYNHIYYMKATMH